MVATDVSEKPNIVTANYTCQKITLQKIKKCRKAVYRNPSKIYKLLSANVYNIVSCLQL